MRCSHRYVSGYRRGQPCPYAAIWVVATHVYDPMLVCGYHARAYHPDVLYRLDYPETKRRQDALALIEASPEAEP